MGGFVRNPTRPMPRVGGTRVLSLANDRDARARERQQLGRLADLVVSPTTLLRYTQAVEQFLLFLSSERHPYPRTFIRLDALLCAFLEHLWMCGDSKSIAANTLSGIQHFVPACRRHIAASWRLYSAWGRTELPARAPPLPRLHMLALAAYCRDQ
eukprot:2910840-Amphidinium_carterae.1